MDNTKIVSGNTMEEINKEIDRLVRIGYVRSGIIQSNGILDYGKYFCKSRVQVYRFNQRMVKKGE